MDVKNLCECYKKLSQLGIPLYIDEESGDYGEDRNLVLYERAFRFPEVLVVNESFDEYPTVGDGELSAVFEQVSEIIPSLSDFDVNVLSFWILDMFIEGLWTAQNAGMNHDHQKVTLLWIAYFFNYIIRQNPTRKQMFRHLKNILFLPEGGDYLHDTSESEQMDGEETYPWPRMEEKKQIWELPLPPPLNDFKGDQQVCNRISSNTQNDVKSQSNSPTSSHLSSIERASDINIKHMNVILEILYRIFGRLWVYMEIQSTFHEMPNIETVDLPFVLHAPKPLLKPEVSATVKSGKVKKPEKSQEEIEAEMQLHKADYILPLQHSEEAKIMAMEMFGQPTSSKKDKDKKK